MSGAVAFHTQLASIMEVLANAAVAEICELVDSGYAVLHVEISRGQKENEALRRKLRLMELKVARASALRQAHGHHHHHHGSGGFASGRASARASSHLAAAGELRRTHGEVPLPRVTALVPTSRCEVVGSTVVVVEDVAPRKSTAGELVKVKTPVIKVEKADEQVWTDTKQDKDFHRATADGRLGGDPEAPPPVTTKQEVTEDHEDGAGGGRACLWGSGTSPTPPQPLGKNLNHSISSCGGSGAVPALAEPSDFDCMMYEAPPIARNAQNPSAADDPGCSYSIGATGVPSASDQGTSFPYVLGEVTRGVAERPQGNGTQSSSEPQMSSRKDLPTVVSNPFVLQGGGEDWASPPQDVDFANGLAAGGYGRGGGDSSSDSAGGGNRTFVCSFCGKTLACLKNLRTHMRVHTGEKPFVCALCGKRFSDSSNLKRHQSVHTGEKRYGCLHCGKRFAQSGSLKVHMSVHTGCKQFKCPHCGKTFISANHLRRHVSSHEGDKQQLPGTFQ